jgi:hypothetical protein
MDRDARTWARLEQHCEAPDRGDIDTRRGARDMDKRKLEVVVVPVFDVDRAKDFYQALGWRLDADFVTAPDFRDTDDPPPRPAAPARPGDVRARSGWMTAVTTSPTGHLSDPAIARS